MKKSFANPRVERLLIAARRVIVRTVMEPWIMDLFCFASHTESNIRIGIASKLWAVSTLPNQQTMAGRRRRAQLYLREGSCGLHSCNPTHSFTTPVIVISTVDQDRIVTDI